VTLLSITADSKFCLATKVLGTSGTSSYTWATFPIYYLGRRSERNLFKAGFSVGDQGDLVLMADGSLSIDIGDHLRVYNRSSSVLIGEYAVIERSKANALTNSVSMQTLVLRDVNSAQ